jgi:hypothetical protein
MQSPVEEEFHLCHVAYWPILLQKSFEVTREQ